MANSFSRILIENMVRGALQEIKDSPGRGARNLVDMALHFSKGRFQKHFFSLAQSMLHNENSAYYSLIQDVAENVDHNRIVKFGMNLGYNGCTLGAKKIRQIEEKERFNIPWSMSLEMNQEILTGQPDSYSSIIKQGMALGIGTYLLFSSGLLNEVLYLAEAYPDCAFILFCSPADITEEIMEKTEHIYNIMFSISYEDEDGTENACRHLRQYGYPFALHYIYRQENAEDILNDELIVCIKNYHPAFAFFIPNSSCNTETKHYVYEYIKHIRNHQLYPVISMDVHYDNIFIDSIISEDACTAGFDQYGHLLKYVDNTIFLNKTLFDTELKDIFKTAFPKN